jgi:hypothetical protein
VASIEPGSNRIQAPGLEFDCMTLGHANENAELGDVLSGPDALALTSRGCVDNDAI